MKLQTFVAGLQTSSNFPQSSRSGVRPHPHGLKLGNFYWMSLLVARATIRWRIGWEALLMQLRHILTIATPRPFVVVPQEHPSWFTCRVDKSPWKILSEWMRRKHLWRSWCKLPNFLIFFIRKLMQKPWIHDYLSDNRAIIEWLLLLIISTTQFKGIIHEEFVPVDFAVILAIRPQ